MLSAVGGLLFGVAWGILLVLVIATASAFVPFYVARRLGRDWVASKLEGKKLEEIYQARHHPRLILTGLFGDRCHRSHISDFCVSV